MASMRHPNVVMYLGLCMDPPCVVTEYCARGSLNDVLKRARQTPALAQQLDWARRWGLWQAAVYGLRFAANTWQSHYNLSPSQRSCQPLAAVKLQAFYMLTLYKARLGRIC